jgi:hypothetical protein
MTTGSSAGTHAETLARTSGRDARVMNALTQWPLTLAEARLKIISLIAARGREDSYAAMLSWWRTGAAHALIHRLYQTSLAGRRKEASAFANVKAEAE